MHTDRLRIMVEDIIHVLYILYVQLLLYVCGVTIHHVQWNLCNPALIGE